MVGITELKQLRYSERREPCILKSHLLLRELASYEPVNATKCLKEAKGYFEKPARSYPCFNYKFFLCHLLDLRNYIEIDLLELNLRRLST